MTDSDASGRPATTQPMWRRARPCYSAYINIAHPRRAVWPARNSWRGRSSNGWST